MANLQFLETGGTKCKGAVAPVLVQEAPITFNTANDGTTATVITAATVTGDPLAVGGTFVNKGCASVIATVTYWSGTTCTACDEPETLVSSTFDWVIPANSVADIPEVSWSEISYVLDQAANDTKTQTVSFQSCYVPECVECLTLLP